MDAIPGGEDEEDVGGEDAGEGEWECGVGEEEALERMPTEVLVGLKIHHKVDRNEQYHACLNERRPVFSHYPGSTLSLSLSSKHRVVAHRNSRLVNQEKANLVWIHIHLRRFHSSKGSVRLLKSDNYQSSPFSWSARCSPRTSTQVSKYVNSNFNVIYRISYPIDEQKDENTDSNDREKRSTVGVTKALTIEQSVHRASEQVPK